MKSHEKEFLAIMLIVVIVGLFTSYLAILGATGLFMSLLVGFALANIIQKARGKPLPSFMPVGLRKGSRPYIVGGLILLITSGILGVGMITQIAPQAIQPGVAGEAVEGPFRIDGNQRNATMTQGGSLKFGGSCTYNMYVLDGSTYKYVGSSGAKTDSFTGTSNGWACAAVKVGSGADGNYLITFESSAGYPMLDEIVSNNGAWVNTKLGDGGKEVADVDDDGDVERGVWFHFTEMAGDEGEVFLLTFNWMGIDANAAEGGNPADNTNVNCVSADVTRTATWRIDISNEHEGIAIKDMYVKINETDKSLVYVDKTDADKAENWLDRTSFTEESFSDHMRYYIVKDLTPEDQCILSRSTGESGAIYITVTFQYLSGGSDGDDVSLRLYLVWYNDAYGRGTSSTYDEIEDTI